MREIINILLDVALPLKTKSSSDNEATKTACSDVTSTFNLTVLEEQYHRAFAAVCSPNPPSFTHFVDGKYNLWEDLLFASQRPRCANVTALHIAELYRDVRRATRVADHLLAWWKDLACGGGGNGENFVVEASSKTSGDDGGNDANNKIKLSRDPCVHGSTGYHYLLCRELHYTMEAVRRSVAASLKETFGSCSTVGQLFAIAPLLRDLTKILTAGAPTKPPSRADMLSTFPSIATRLQEYRELLEMPLLVTLDEVLRERGLAFFFDDTEMDSKAQHSDLNDSGCSLVSRAARRRMLARIVEFCQSGVVHFTTVEALLSLCATFLFDTPESGLGTADEAAPKLRQLAERLVGRERGPTAAAAKVVSSTKEIFPSAEFGTAQDDNDGCWQMLDLVVLSITTREQFTPRRSQATEEENPSPTAAAAAEDTVSTRPKRTKKRPTATTAAASANGGSLDTPIVEFLTEVMRHLLHETSVGSSLLDRVALLFSFAGLPGIPLPTVTHKLYQAVRLALQQHLATCIAKGMLLEPLVAFLVEEMHQAARCYQKPSSSEAPQDRDLIPAPLLQFWDRIKLDLPLDELLDVYYRALLRRASTNGQQRFESLHEMAFFHTFFVPDLVLRRSAYYFPRKGVPPLSASRVADVRSMLFCCERVFVDCRDGSETFRQYAVVVEQDGVASSTHSPCFVPMENIVVLMDTPRPAYEHVDVAGFSGVTSCARSIALQWIPRTVGASMRLAEDIFNSVCVAPRRRTLRWIVSKMAVHAIDHWSGATYRLTLSQAWALEALHAMFASPSLMDAHWRALSTAQRGMVTSEGGESCSLTAAAASSAANDKGVVGLRSPRSNWMFQFLVQLLLRSSTHGGEASSAADTIGAEEPTPALVLAAEEVLEELCHAKVLSLSPVATTILQQHQLSGSTACTAEVLRQVEDHVIPLYQDHNKHPHSSAGATAVDCVRYAKVRKHLVHQNRAQCDQQSFEALFLRYLKSGCGGDENGNVIIGSNDLHMQLISQMNDWLATACCVNRQDDTLLLHKRAAGYERMSRTLLRSTPEQFQLCVKKLHERDYIEVTPLLQSEGLQLVRFKP